MPLWLQLVSALCSAAASGFMGAAMVPFLQKMRFCEPEEKKDKGTEAAGGRLKPTMCGILAVFGCLFGLALSFSLYCTFCEPDRTSSDFREATVSLVCGLLGALFCALIGFHTDYRSVRRRPLRRIPLPLRFAAAFLGILVLLLVWNALSGTAEPTLMDFGFRRVNAGWLFYPLTAAAGAVCLLSASGTERETDGISVTVGSVVLLGMTVLLIQQLQEISALWALTAAGSCMGCFVWNLHPAKCRLGSIGSFWLGGAVTMLCIMSRLHMALLLVCAVYLLDRIPAMLGRKAGLQERLQQAGLNAWQRIAVLSVFAAFSAVIAVLAYQ